MDWEKLNIKNKHSNIIVDNNFDLTPYIAASESVIFTETIAGMQSAVMGKKQYPTILEIYQHSEIMQINAYQILMNLKL